MTGIKQTEGRAFDRSAGHTYFLAATMSPLKAGSRASENLLIAVNEIQGEADIQLIEDWMGSGKKVFIDSGIFWLTNEHKKRHNISMDEALGLAPEEIDGFDELYAKYTRLINRLGQDSWGYIELDQGGMENKIRTRTRLENEGFRPIPVYHPFNDGWDYFDYLAQNYDRICFGNVVQANSYERLRLIATAWERKRQYPDLWIHLLGYTPNETLCALPINSGDSSSWLAAIRWVQGYTPKVCLKSFGRMQGGYRYRRGAEKDENDHVDRAVMMAAYATTLNTENWRTHLDRLEKIGLNPHGVCYATNH